MRILHENDPSRGVVSVNPFFKTPELLICTVERIEDLLLAAGVKDAYGGTIWAIKSSSYS